MRNLIASIALVCTLLATCSVAQEYRPPTARTARQSVPRAGVPKRPEGPQNPRRVSPASYVEGEIIHDGGYIEGEYIEGEYIEGEYLADGGCDGCAGGCDSCGLVGDCNACGGAGCDACMLGGPLCGSCHSPHRFCICFPSHGWVHADYLLWFHSGMSTPPFVTTSPANTARSDAGVLGESGTSVLFGNDDYLTSDRSGFRIRFGWWLSAFPGWGVEGEYLGFDDSTEGFYQMSNGSPIIARPFFNVLEGAEDSELVAYPNVVTGAMTVALTSKFDGAAVRFRKQLCGSDGCCFSNLTCRTVPYSSRLEATIGYRYWQLSESLNIGERLQLQSTASPGSFDITDRFETRNQFNGTELGVLWQGRRGWWSLDALMRVGIGDAHQTVTISGASQITENSAMSTYDTGFLAQKTNIGTYDRDKFVMVPEIGLTLGYQLTRRMRITTGYSSIYWGSVVRPGDQVDLDLNPNLLAPEVEPFTGPLRPQFQFAETDYWIHGLSFGAEFRW